MRTMKAKKKKNNTEERQAAQANEDSIKEQVFARLGRPKNLARTTIVFCKEGCHARINIWCDVPTKKEVGYFASVRNTIFDERRTLTDTFYLRLSPEAGIIEASPQIKKKYA